jgi:hypothetical protein
VKKIIALVALGLLALAVSCDTENVGNGGPQFFNVQITSVTPADPAGLFGNEQVTFTAAVTGGSPPYTYSWNFGGASTPNVVTSPAGTTTTVTVTLTPSAAAATYTVTVTATDGNGIQSTDTETINVGATRNAAPVVNSATYAAGVLTVTVSDPDDGETLDVTVTPPAGFNVDATTKTAAATGPLTATFNVTATDVIAGATGNFGVSVTDGDATTQFAGGVDVTIPALTLAADTLYGTPLAGSAAANADVTILVLTGDPANPFQYMNGVGLVLPTDASYTALSFDVGAADATPDNPSATPVDGAWATMNPGGGFLFAPDNFISPVDMGGGTERYDFNITPLGGSDQATFEGILFNAKFKFATTGPKTIAFVETAGVKRTYYSDGAATEYFWGNITNDGSLVPNSVTIN